MEPVQIPSFFPEDTWHLILSQVPLYISVRCLISSKIIRKTLLRSPSLFDVLWNASGLSLPNECQALKSKDKLKKLSQIMTVNTAEVTAALVDTARFSSMQCDGFPHGCQTVVTTHEEDLPYGYSGATTICADLWDLSRWPNPNSPASFELGQIFDMDQVGMFVVGKNYLCNRIRADGTITVNALHGDTWDEEYEQVSLVPPVDEYNSLHTSPNMHADYPWLLVVGAVGQNETHIWIRDFDKKRWTAESPLILSSKTDNMIISFYGPWIAVLMADSRILEVYRLHSSGKPPIHPQVRVTLVKFPCSLAMTKIQLAVSMHQLVLFYIPIGLDKHAQLLAVPLDSSFSQLIQERIDRSCDYSITLDCVHPSQTSRLFLTATENFIFASIQRDLFVINAFNKKLVSVIRADKSIMSKARAMDAALFVVATQSNMVAIDFCGRGSGFSASQVQVTFYNVYIQDRHPLVEEESCRGSHFARVLQRLLPQDLNHGAIVHSHLLDRETNPKDTRPNVLIFSRSETTDPASLGQSLVGKTLQVVSSIAQEREDPPVAVLTPEEHALEAQTDATIAQLAKSGVWYDGQPKVPDAVMIRYGHRDGIPQLLEWSLDKAQRAAEVFVKLRDIKKQ